MPDASEHTLREHWDRVENELHAIVDYVQGMAAGPRSTAEFRALNRAVRELDQYARALRWVMTVSQWDRQ